MSVPYRTSHHTRTQSDLDVFNAEADCWKHTSIGDYVVKRRVRLYRDRVVTFPHIEAGTSDHKTWKLYPESQLNPADSKDIQKKKRRIRPDNVGHLTALAAMAGKGQTIELYTFRVDDFTFGFEDLEPAQEWHGLLAQQLSELAATAGITPSKTRVKAPNKLARPSDDDFSSQARVTAERRTTDSSDYTTPGQANNASESDNEDALAEFFDYQLGTTSSAMRRWIPFKHSNGVAIYQHQVESHRKGKQVAQTGEYMVSAVVRGTPLECLRVLLNPHDSTTTILGPATEVEVLESEQARQVLRIQIQASGSVGRYYAPREAIVQRLLKKEEDGIWVVLFSSVDTFEAKQQQQDGADGGVIEEAEGLEGSEASSRRSRPVQCRVNGGYTISRLEKAKGTVSPESLITCVLQVEDMGGWLSPAWRHALWWLTGSTAYDAYIERMLMTVILVKDQVEQSRFAVKPTVIRTQVEPAVEAKQAPSADLDFQVASGMSRTSTFVMRQAANQLARPGAPATAATAGAGISAHRLPPMPSFSKMSRMATVRQPSVLLAPPDRIHLLGSLPEGLEGPDGLLEEPTCSVPNTFWEELHTPGGDYPFKVRGPNYLRDSTKIQAGEPELGLLALELFNTGDTSVSHISRYLPSVRRSSKAFMFVMNIIVPGPPTLSLVFVYGTEFHPDALGPPPEDPDEGDWQPFDYLIYRFVKGSDEDRKNLFKLIPHIAQGSWVIKQSVGSTPVILARKLGTSYHITEKYVEVSVDVGSNSTANYVTGMVRGATKSLVVDLAILLEGQHAYELPETLLGACRLNKLDLSVAKKLDTSMEVPIRHVYRPTTNSSSGTAVSAHSNHGMA